MARSLSVLLAHVLACTTLALAPPHLLSPLVVRRQMPRATLLMGITVTAPGQDDAVAMGVREWPGFLPKEVGNFVEACEGGEQRYVLEGRGSVSASGEPGVPLTPGSLVTVDAACELSWQVEEKMMILTPRFEQPWLFAGLFVVVFGLFGYLLANAG